MFMYIMDIRDCSTTLGAVRCKLISAIRFGITHVGVHRLCQITFCEHGLWSSSVLSVVIEKGRYPTVIASNRTGDDTDTNDIYTYWWSGFYYVSNNSV